MPRTTVDIDDAVLLRVRAIARAEGKTVARVISDLLQQALKWKSSQQRPFTWRSKLMYARVDIESKGALYEVDP